jgi:hypothetical protein
MRTIPPTATDIKCVFDGYSTEVTYMNGNRLNIHIFAGENKIIGNQIVKIENQLNN